VPRLPLLVLTLVLLALLPAAAPAQAPPAEPPVVVTGPAESVAATSATLAGSVDPDGVETVYRFQYGTTTAYGLQTANVGAEPSAGAGTEPVTVRLPVTGLTASTTYHVRLVARTAAGETFGADRVFTTPAAPVNPTAPRAFTLRATEKTTSSARVAATVNPGGAATTARVEWGTSSTRLSGRADLGTLPAGRTGVRLSKVLDGLPAYRRIYWRVVASNAAGSLRSGIASFTTLRAPAQVELAVSPGVALWSDLVSLRGRVRGSGVSGVTVALEQASFPYSLGFAPVATARANSSGRFSFPPQPVFLATRFRAVTRSTVVQVSPTVETLVRAQVGVRTGRRTKRRVTVFGTVRPGLPTGRASLQKRSRSGRWVPQQRKALVLKPGDRSEYVFRAKRGRRPGVFRVAAVARDGGAHLTGYSSAVVVPAKAVKRKKRRG